MTKLPGDSGNGEPGTYSASQPPRGRVLSTGPEKWADFFWLNSYKTAKFVKQYANVADIIGDAFRRYVADVQTGVYPDETYSYKMAAGEYEKLLALLKSPA